MSEQSRTMDLFNQRLRLVSNHDTLIGFYKGPSTSRTTLEGEKASAS